MTSKRGKGLTITVSSLNVMQIAKTVSDGNDVIGLCGNEDLDKAFYFEVKQIEPLIRALRSARDYLNEAEESPATAFYGFRTDLEEEDKPLTDWKPGEEDDDNE